MPEGLRRGLAPGVIDETVAANLRRHREARGLSQAELAARMSDLGWRYHPQTVHKNENGLRKITIGEGQVLASILGVHLERLSWPEGEEAMIRLGELAISRIRQAADEVANAVASLHGAQAGAEGTIRSLRADNSRDPSENVSVTLEALEMELAEATLENAVDKGDARWERLMDGEGYVESC